MIRRRRWFRVSTSSTNDYFASTLPPRHLSKLRWLSSLKGVSKPLFVSILFIFLTSCSLKYSESVNPEDHVPEFVFENTAMTRFEESRPTFEMQSEVLEQYKNNKETYGKNLKFSAYDKEGKISTQGECGMLYADTDKKVYELYDNVQLYNVEEEMRFYANILRWNEKTEQLTSGRSDMVKIEKDDTTIRGSGFSADGVSKQFSFSGNVTGNIETSEDSGESLESEQTEQIEKNEQNEQVMENAL